MATYRLLDVLGIAAMIDLNERGKDGTPVCEAGLAMKYNGTDKTNKNRMFRCPYGKCHAEKCACSCSPAKYGKTVKVRLDKDPRHYTKVPQHGRLEENLQGTYRLRAHQ